MVNWVMSLPCALEIAKSALILDKSDLWRPIGMLYETLLMDNTLSAWVSVCECKEGRYIHIYVLVLSGRTNTELISLILLYFPASESVSIFMYE